MEPNELREQVVAQARLFVFAAAFALGAASSFCRTARDNEYRDWVNLFSIACVAGFSAVAIVAIYHYFFGSGVELSDVDIFLALAVGLTGKTAESAISAIYEKMVGKMVDVVGKMVDIIVAMRQK